MLVPVLFFCFLCLFLIQCLSLSVSCIFANLFCLVPCIYSVWPGLNLDWIILNLLVVIMLVPVLFFCFSLSLSYTLSSSSSLCLWPGLNLKWIILNLLVVIMLVPVLFFCFSMSFSYTCLSLSLSLLHFCQSVLFGAMNLFGVPRTKLRLNNFKSSSSISLSYTLSSSLCLLHFYYMCCLVPWIYLVGHEPNLILF